MVKKKNTKLVDRSDILAAALCLAGAFFCLWFFQVDLNRSLRRYSEQPLGTVSWKRRAAQRRFTDRVLWDRLRQDSPVYSGDYIRTEDLSAAAVAFTSGGIIELGENSLIRIFDEDRTPRVQLRAGTLSARARNTELLVTAGENRVLVNSGGAVSARAEDAVLRVRVEEGSASLYAAGDTREAAAGEGFSLSPGALENAPTDFSVSAAPGVPPQKPPALFTPGEDEVIRYQGDMPSIRFRWEIPAEDGLVPFYYILEVSDNPDLENPFLILQTRTGGASASVPAPGLWYWRVTPVYTDSPEPESSRSASGSFVVEEGTPPAPPELFVPPPEDTALRTIFPPEGYIVAEALLPDLRFTWKAPPGAARFQVSGREDFSRLEADESVSGKTWQLRRLESGSWYWRISAGGRDSPARRFIVAPSLAAPVPVDGAQSGIVRQGGREEAVFRWQPAEEADYYEFRFYEGQSGRLLRSETLTGNSARIPLESYADGPYRWTVQAFVHQTAASTRRESLAASTPFELNRRSPAETTRVQAAARAAEEARARAAAQATREAAARAPAPLTAPRLDSPANGFLFDADRLRGITGISFGWAAVDGAEAYNVALFSADGKTLLSGRTAGPSWFLPDLSILSKGQFRWQVRALRQGPAGEEQGPGSDSFFTVDIPEVRRNRLEDIGTLYGR
ncbi:MAG: FecR family protein [Treponema sp.]|jgi:hypothetical protein|nr:FecR family protein [Treponema sp.]